MIWVAIALAVGLVIGATERTAITNSILAAEKRLADRIAKLESKING